MDPALWKSLIDEEVVQLCERYKAKGVGVVGGLRFAKSWTLASLC